MTDFEQATHEESVAPEVVESESAKYLRIRKANKAEAAVTMAANAKEAERAKRKARARGFTIEGQDQFLADARRIEQAMNAPANTEEV